MVMRKLLLSLLVLFSTPAFAAAAPVFDVSAPPCKLGMHCPVTITKTGTATSYSDVALSVSGAAVAPVSTTVRFLKADKTKTIYTPSSAIGPFFAVIKRVRYATIGQGTATGTVFGPPPTTTICPDGQQTPIGTPCPPPLPPKMQTCSDGSMIPVTSVCPPPAPPPPPPPPAGIVQATQACSSLNGNGAMLVIGQNYSVAGYAGYSQPGNPPPPAGTKDIYVVGDATHRGDGWFAIWVPSGCFSAPAPPSALAAR